MSIDLNVISLNVQGLRNRAKRLKIFQYCKRFRANYVLLQETHSLMQDELGWKRDWGNDIFFSHGTSHSAGVAILIGKSNEKVNNSNVMCDNQGRYIILEVELNKEVITLMNLYGPNDDKGQKMYYEQIHRLLLTKVSGTQLLLGGDFNIFLDHTLDKKGGIARDRQALQTINNMIDDLSLVDVWRKQNPYKKCYTWPARQNPPVACRLDYWLVSASIVKNVVSVKINESIGTDHKLIQIKQKYEGENLRGPGFWKFNNSLLEDGKYKLELKKVIERKKEEHKNIQDARVKWDLLKYEIQSYTLTYSRAKARLRRELEFKLDQELRRLDNEMCDCENPSDELVAQYSQIKRQLEKLMEYRARGEQIRSRMEWQEKGEKGTKFFFNLEKNRKSKSVVKELKIGNEILTNQKDILSEEKHFYEELYSEKSSERDKAYTPYFFNEIEIPKLTEEEKLSCEGILSDDECWKALIEMGDNKSPGSDGLTKEFYKVFWSEINIELLEGLNTGYSLGELSNSQKQGIITLLQKEGKDLSLLKNWRPVLQDLWITR